MTDWFHIQSLIHAILINESLCIRSDFIGSYDNVLSQWQLRSLSTRIRSPCWKEKPPTFKDQRFNAVSNFSPFFLFLFLFLFQPEAKECRVSRSSKPFEARSRLLSRSSSRARFRVGFVVSVHVAFLPRRKLGRNFVEANKVAGLDKKE